MLFFCLSFYSASLHKGHQVPSYPALFKGRTVKYIIFGIEYCNIHG
jgi:hypothetical protein